MGLWMRCNVQPAGSALTARIQVDVRSTTIVRFGQRTRIGADLCNAFKVSPG